MNQPEKINFPVIVACMFGNCLEWYDFILYAFLAPVIARLFFPKSDHHSALLASFAIFALGYLVRPLGGILWGYWGDVFSRKKTLVASLLLMGSTTAIIGLLPTYQRCGFWAPLALTLLRLVQGLAVGGEYPGAMVVLVESAPEKWRASVSALGFMGALVGVLLAASLSTLMSHLVSHDFFISYGWRILFVLGLLLALVGVYLRLAIWSKQDDAEVMLHTPIVALLQSHFSNTLRCFILWCQAAIYTAVTSLFLVSYLTHFLGFNLKDALFYQMLLTVVMGVFFLLGAFLCDWWQCHRIWIRLGLVFVFVSAYPLYRLMSLGHASAVIAFVLLTLVGAMATGPMIKLCVESFPVQVRYTGMGLTQGLAFSLLGGTAPMVLLVLIHRFGVYAPAFYLMLSTAVAVFMLPKQL